MLDKISVTAPKALAFDNQGNLLIASEKRIVRVSRSDKTLRTLTGSTTSPYRIDVDRTNGDILVAESGTNQQIKRFNSSGVLLATYGWLGGRAFGLYNPNDFRAMTDISSDQQGGFLVSERSAPRRVARFDRNGRLVKEWFGGANWTPQATPETGNPSVVWAQADQEGEYLRLTLDDAARTWKVHSVYRPEILEGEMLFTFGVSDALNPYRVNGRLYLAHQARNVEVWLIDESNWTLKPVSAARFEADQGNLWIRTDANGDGAAQASECRRFNKNIYGSIVRKLFANQKSVTRISKYPDEHENR